MKKKYILATGITLFLLTLILLMAPKSLKSDLIINKLRADLPMPMLYYSDISSKKILSYTLQDNKLDLSQDKLMPFTEGFLPKDTYTFYMNILRESTASSGITLPKYFYDFYENEKFAVISFGQELKDIYIIEKNNLRVHTLTYPEPLNMGPMYMSHAQIVDDYLIILAGEASAYNALIYTIHLPTFNVVDAIRFPTHSSATDSSDYLITPEGKCVFINGKGLKVYDVLASTYRLVNLDFPVTEVINYKNYIIALGSSTETLHYAQLDVNYTLIASGQLTPPVPNSIIVDSKVYADNLYIISYDTNYQRYANYVSIYNLNANELIYCLGIYPNDPYALLESSLPK